MTGVVMVTLSARRRRRDARRGIHAEQITLGE
jgi:hypothetical protein